MAKSSVSQNPVQPRIGRGPPAEAHGRVLMHARLEDVNFLFARSGGTRDGQLESAQQPLMALSDALISWNSLL